MSAPDVFTLYDFETQIEPAVQAVLVAALAGASPPISAQVLTTGNVATKDTPRIEVQFDTGAAGLQMTTIGQANPRQVPNSFSGTLQIGVWTTRPVDVIADLHGIIRGLVRYSLSAGAKVFTTSNLPYLQILDMLPADSSSAIQNEKEQDGTVMTYAVKFAIRNDAWPATS